MADSKAHAKARDTANSRLGALLFLLIWLIALRGTIIRNVTSSEPLGYYLMLPAWHVHLGSMVAVCEPPAAYAFEEAHGAAAVHSTLPIRGCPQNRLLIKNVWGLPGDKMAVSRRGVLRNGILLSHSRPISRLPDGAIPSTAAATIVPLKFVWAGSPVPLSFDSRYFGPVPVLARAVHVPDWFVNLIVLAAALTTLLIARGGPKENPPTPR